jgi:hypothetical protein
LGENISGARIDFDDGVKVFKEAVWYLYARKAGGTDGKFVRDYGRGRFGGEAVSWNFVDQEGFWVASLEEGVVEISEKSIEGVRIIADSMATDREGVGKGAFGVWRVATVVVEVMLFVCWLCVDGGVEFVIG